MMKRIFLVLVTVSLGLWNIAAQERLIEKANQKYGEYSFSPAIDIYKKVLEKGYVSTDMLKRLGNSYYFNAQYPEAAETYKRLLDEYPDEMGIEYYFRYAQALKSLGDYDTSNLMMSKFTAMASGDGRADLYAKEGDYLEEIKSNSGRYELGTFPHNSKYADFAPSFYKQGLLFSSDRDTGNLAKYRHTWNSKDFLDLYHVDTDSISKNRVVKFDGNINTKLHESTSAATKDGETVYFTRNNIVEGKYVRDREGMIRLKIFRARYREGVWTQVEDLPFNSDAYSVAHPALSPDEKTLYFASDMPGSLGESDIFRVSIKEDGTFGTPENLGNNINTEARETFPFVSQDEILYFSSNGHLGLGGLDIFATKIAFGAVSGKVANVGEPVNGTADDFTFIFDSDTKKGYFASNRKTGIGEDDIYSFVELEPLALDCIQKISGSVRDNISNEVLAGATVRVINEDNIEIASTITNPSGDYELTIDCNKGNFIRASMEGYVPAEEYLGKSDGKPKIVDFYLERDKVTAGFGDDLAKLLQLSTIYFDLNKYDIRKDAALEIQKVVAAMEKYPSLKLQVNSHTDSRGPDAYNLWLSQKRAEATVKYMVSEGISEDRLMGEGFGETRLVNDCGNRSNCSDQQHQLNRRSEFIIIE
ncbi:MAG: OmpA family protein [Sediminicola sp.]|tara:strand:+ start:1304 stop:3241 length:1938 start_codon:yes stop_codon:yes gene_type:complete